MFKSFSAKNFRCFPTLNIDNLASVNLFSGKNNVGKTALLEAIFLLLGPDNPQLPMMVNVLRGIQWFDAIPEEAWGWLFRNKDTQGHIQLSGTTSQGERLTLGIHLADAQMAPLPPEGNGKGISSKTTGSATTALGAKNLVLEYKEGAREPVTSRAWLVPEGQGVKVQFERAGKPLPLFDRPSPGRPLGVFLASTFSFASENAQRFSRLQEVGKEKDVMGPLKILEPRLVRLVVSALGAGPVIQGDLGIGRLVPIQLMGEGISKLLSYLLAIADAQGGTVLIDEIENGLHYTVLPKVWSAIADFAEEYQTQVFVTTHSLECIHAAHEAFLQRDEKAFLYHRLDRAKDVIKCMTFDREMLSTAMATGLEPR